MSVFNSGMLFYVFPFLKQISTKGAILFDTPAEPQSRMIAPFYADIDNRFVFNAVYADVVQYIKIQCAGVVLVL